MKVHWNWETFLCHQTLLIAALILIIRWCTLIIIYMKFFLDYILSNSDVCFSCIIVPITKWASVVYILSTSGCYCLVLTVIIIKHVVAVCLLFDYSDLPSLVNSQLSFLCVLCLIWDLSSSYFKICIWNMLAFDRKCLN